MHNIIGIIKKVFITGVALVLTSNTALLTASVASAESADIGGTPVAVSPAGPEAPTTGAPTPTTPEAAPAQSRDAGGTSTTNTDSDSNEDDAVDSPHAGAAAPDVPAGSGAASTESAPAASAPASPSVSGENTTLAAPANPSADGSTGVTDTGPGSRNTANRAAALNRDNHSTTDIGMNNDIALDATSGNTRVTDNTDGGDATSGNAQSVANIANLLQSSGTTAFGPGTKTFTADINGDVTGDFMFDPAAILNTGPGSTNAANNSLKVNTNDSNSTNARINNNIDVGATSGNATVADNTTGGNATTGNAQAVVNLMNLINSTVAAGQSFVGTVNINGDLNGDILLPPGVLDQLLASSGPGSNNLVSTNLANNSVLTNTANLGINNDITSTATTGNARVSDNTRAGSATSGTAGTNVTLLNLTGSNVVGKNNLLVFVNVLGTWVGMIMNAPQGANTAQLGGGVTSNTGPGSNNTLLTDAALNSTATNTANLGINNKVNVHANSGNANVTENTLAGNARSGNAKTAVNILNLQGSNLSLSDWFGVLFINVFGKWTGSFGVNTSAGDPVIAAAGNGTTPPTGGTPADRSLANFITQNTPRNTSGWSGTGTGGGAGSSNSNGSIGGNSADTSNTTGGSGNATLASEMLDGTTAPASLKEAVQSSADTAARLSSPRGDTHARYTLPLIGFGVAGIMLFMSERDRFGSKKQKK